MQRLTFSINSLLRYETFNVLHVCVCNLDQQVATYNGNIFIDKRLFKFIFVAIYIVVHIVIINNEALVDISIIISL